MHIRSKRIGLSVEFAAHKKEMAHLFLETYYTTESNKERGTNYNTTICILGDQNVWHLFIADISCHPYKVLNYYPLD